MNWTIPGTVLVQPRAEATHIREQFSSMFLGGGLLLSQVSGITGLEAYTVQNWVKRGFLSPPEKKRYSLQQLCRIITVNMLKSVLPMERVCGLLGYINGQLDDASDDMIDDAELYFLFVRLAARARYIGGTRNWDEALEEITASYSEPVPGARQKLIRVLKIMLTIWVANTLRQKADEMISQL